MTSLPCLRDSTVLTLFASLHRPVLPCCSPQSPKRRRTARNAVDSDSVAAKLPNRPAPPAPSGKASPVEEEIASLDAELADLRIAFEQFFLGYERKSPASRRDAFARRLRKLQESGLTRNTGAKFRLEQVASRFRTYDRLWTRTQQEIEQGTYRRDVERLQRKQRTQTKTTEAPAPPQSSAPPDAPPLSDSQMRQLFDTYLLARKRTNEPTAGITLEGLSATLRKQVPALMQKHNAQGIDFKVIIKDGKALLKAVPRK